MPGAIGVAERVQPTAQHVLNGGAPSAKRLLLPRDGSPCRSRPLPDQRRRHQWRWGHVCGGLHNRPASGRRRPGRGGDMVSTGPGIGFAFAALPSVTGGSSRASMELPLGVCLLPRRLWVGPPSTDICARPSRPLPTGRPRAPCCSRSPASRIARPRSSRAAVPPPSRTPTGCGCRLRRCCSALACRRHRVPSRRGAGFG